jgi:hypothetical protein
MLILLTIAFVHLNRPATAVVNLVVFSTAVACCLVLLMVHDRPFAAGGIFLVYAARLRTMEPRFPLLVVGFSETVLERTSWPGKSKNCCC